MQVTLLNNTLPHYIDRKNINNPQATPKAKLKMPSLQTLQGYSNISFKQNLPKDFSTIKSYNQLNNVELSEVRRTANKQLKMNEALSTEEGLFLIETLADEVVTKCEGNRIVSLGRSPIPILEMSKMMQEGIDDYTYIGFSEGSLIEEGRPTSEWNLPYSIATPTKDWIYQKSIFRPTEEQYNNYKSYLKQNEMDPKSIIKKAKQGEKTAIIDFVYSGGGMRAFLEILRNWSLEQGNYNELKKSLTVVPLYYSDYSQSDGIFEDERIYPTNDDEKTVTLNLFNEFNKKPIDILEFDNKELYRDIVNDKGSIYFEKSYPYNKWNSKYGPKRGPREGHELKAELAKFNIIDYLAKNNILK